jgi:hypothetical protein
MCVALVVNEDTCPTLDDLKLMEKDNPHGGGMAWAGKNRVHYRKGLTAPQIWALLQRIPRPALVHFRWATHGEKIPQLCHPFPLGERAFNQRLRGTAQAVLIHNGTWHDYTRHVPQWAQVLDQADLVSDTQVAAYHAASDPGILEHIHWSTAVGRYTVPYKLDVEMRGQWELHSDGVYYSNLGWLPKQHVWSFPEEMEDAMVRFDNVTQFDRWLRRNERRKAVEMGPYAAPEIPELD